MKARLPVPIGLDCGNPVATEREEIISDLIVRGLKFAPLAVRKSRSFAEFYALRSDLRSKNGDGKPDGVAIRVKKRIVRGLMEEERGH